MQKIVVLIIAIAIVLAAGSFKTGAAIAQKREPRSRLRPTPRPQLLPSRLLRRKRRKASFKSCSLVDRSA